MVAFGRRPPKNAPALRLSTFLKAGAVPAHPSRVDYLEPIKGSWRMLGNDVAGDCVAVTWANLRYLTTSTIGATANYPTQDQVWTLYKTQNPTFSPNGGSQFGPGSPADQGMDIQTCLEYLAKQGGPDGVAAIGFAKVDNTNLDEVKAALALFGGIWTGLNVQSANMDEFNAGQPWDYTPGGANDGGHSVISGGYTGTPSNDVQFITWAAETSFTDSFWTNLVEEAWVVIWPEHLGSKSFLKGVDVNQLSADYEAITGRPFPVFIPPTPAPPIPTPVPIPPVNSNDVVADHTLATEALPWVEKRHVGSNKIMQKSLNTWLAERGFK